MLLAVFISCSVTSREFSWEIHVSQLFKVVCITMFISSSYILSLCFSFVQKTDLYIVLSEWFLHLSLSFLLWGSSYLLRFPQIYHGIILWKFWPISNKIFLEIFHVPRLFSLTSSSFSRMQHPIIQKVWNTVFFTLFLCIVLAFSTVKLCLVFCSL